MMDEYGNLQKIRLTRKRFTNGGIFSQTIYSETQKKLANAGIRCSFEIFNPHKPKRSQQCSRIPRKTEDGRGYTSLCEIHSPTPEQQRAKELQFSVIPKVKRGPIIETVNSFKAVANELTKISDHINDDRYGLKHTFKTMSDYLKIHPETNTKLNNPTQIHLLSYHELSDLNEIEREIKKQNDYKIKIARQIQKEKKEQLDQLAIQYAIDTQLAKEAEILLKARQEETKRQTDELLRRQNELEVTSKRRFEARRRQEEEKKIQAELERRVIEEINQETEIQRQRMEQLKTQRSNESKEEIKRAGERVEQLRIQQEQKQQEFYEKQRQQQIIEEEFNRKVREDQEKREAERQRLANEILERQRRDEEAAEALREAQRKLKLEEDEKSRLQREADLAKEVEKDANSRSSATNQYILLKQLNEKYLLNMNLAQNVVTVIQSVPDDQKPILNSFRKKIGETLGEPDVTILQIDQLLQGVPGTTTEDFKNFIKVIKNTVTRNTQDLTIPYLWSISYQYLGKKTSEVLIALKIALRLYDKYDKEYISRWLTTDDMKRILNITEQQSQVKEEEESKQEAIRKEYEIQSSKKDVVTQINNISKWVIQSERPTEKELKELEVNTIYQRNMKQPVRVYVRVNYIKNTEQSNINDRGEPIFIDEEKKDDLTGEQWDLQNVTPYSLNQNKLGSFITLGLDANEIAKEYGPFYSIYPHTFSVDNKEIYGGVPQGVTIFGEEQKVKIKNQPETDLTSGELVKPNEPLKGVFDLAKTGYNITLCTFGVSGSGKTYSLFGRKDEEEGKIDLGIVQLGLKTDASFETTIHCVFELYGKVMNVTQGNQKAEIHCYQYYGKKDCSSFLQQDDRRTTGEGVIFNLRKQADMRQGAKPTDTGAGANKIIWKDDDERVIIQNMLIANGKLTEEDKEKELSLKGDDLQVLYTTIENHRKSKKRIKRTPNNPESSRGHLFIVIQLRHITQKRNSYFTLIDMAGAEDPESLSNEFFKDPDNPLQPMKFSNVLAQFINDDRLKAFKNNAKQNLYTKLQEGLNPLQISELVSDAVDIISEGFFINDSILSLRYFLADMTFKRQQLESDSKTIPKQLPSFGDVKLNEPTSISYMDELNNKVGLIFNANKEQVGTYKSGKSTIFFFDDISGKNAKRAYPITMYSILRDLGRLPAHYDRDQMTFEANDGFKYSRVNKDALSDDPTVDKSKDFKYEIKEFKEENLRLQYMILTVLRISKDNSEREKEIRSKGRTMTLNFANNFRIQKTKKIDQKYINEQTFLKMLNQQYKEERETQPVNLKIQ